MINYKHLQYFWRVARAGGLARASDEAHVTPQTISEQLHELEAALGARLFERRGRRLELTESGQVAFDYAERIFALGAEAEAVLRGSADSQSVLFRIGVADVVPKAVAHRLIEPAMHIGRPVHLTAREWKLDGLLAELAVHRLDMVIADTPTPPGTGVRAFNHRLGETGLCFFASRQVVDRMKGEFPANLHRMPVLMPGQDTALYGRLVRWFERHHIAPDLVAEFDDAALMKAFGRAGLGIFSSPAALAPEIATQYSVVAIGTTDEVRQEFYAISVQRRTTHPCVRAIFDHAGTSLPALAPDAISPRASRKVQRALRR
ncbi:MAG: transcriptional activator NhaR [Betaproteobacteria bacterium]